MDNKTNQMNVNGVQEPPKGEWVPVDASTLGFQMSPMAPGQEVVGPDGNKYSYRDVPDICAPVASNVNGMNVIPTPSSIVQMPPIVQPIALVPYTSQNQPLLQYDPYSRPVDPQRPQKAPNYVIKPYRGLSIAAMIVSIISLIALLFLAVGVFKANDMRAAYNTNGIDCFKALFAMFGLDVNSSYYADRIAANAGKTSENILDTIICYALPIIVIIMVVVFVILAIKYINKLAKKKTPRCFSVGAFINIILSISVIAILLGMTNGELAQSERAANTSAFFTFDASIVCGAGAIISLIASIVLLILPLCAKKNAYVLNEEDPTLKAQFLDNSDGRRAHVIGD